jgi:threonine/homoserine/homoserine lactone efflux protein
MSYLIEGFLFGLMLAVMIGPIFIAITQTSMERGVIAGLLVSLGEWISDFLIIGGIYFFIQAVKDTVESTSFKFYFDLVGGIVMILFGLGVFFKTVDIEIQKTRHSYRNMIGFWLKGFLVNTVNPFTFIFWITTISTYVIGRKATGTEALSFLGAVMATIIVMDILKVFAAKAIRKKLTSRNIYWFSKLSGVGLALFGIYLIFRVA